MFNAGTNESKKKEEKPVEITLEPKKNHAHYQNDLCVGHKTIVVQSYLKT